MINGSTRGQTDGKEIQNPQHCNLLYLLPLYAYAFNIYTNVSIQRLYIVFFSHSEKNNSSLVRVTHVWAFHMHNIEEKCIRGGVWTGTGGHGPGGAWYGPGSGRANSWSNFSSAGRAWPGPARRKSGLYSTFGPQLTPNLCDCVLDLFR